MKEWYFKNNQYDEIDWFTQFNELNNRSIWDDKFHELWYKYIKWKERYWYH